tara:strand:+ start:6987 stop:7679 length:693 start_codon:yes stop_codon:yes gene_type:complete
MATFNEISYDILEILKNNQISDDTDISLEHILYHVNNQRALFLRNEYNKPGRKIDPHLISDLGCLKLIEVDAAECCSVDIGCIALRTEKKLPALLELHSGPAIQRVGPVNKLDTPYSVTTGTVSSFRKYNKYTGNDIQAVYLNDYIYIIASTPADQGIQYINARVIAADPSDLLDYRCDSTSTPCFSFDDQYPINNWMIPYIKEQILKQFGMSLQIPKDDDNNAKDNISK